MRKYLVALFIAVFTLAALKPNEARAELPVKARAFLTMVGYGTAGGALLGVASMAFGGSTRAVAQGASLGLYSGILFGTYILASHHQRRGSYEDDSSVYKESSDLYGDEYQDDEGGSKDEDEDTRGGFFDRFQVLQEKFHNQSFTLKSERQRGGRMPPLHINLFQMNF